MLPDKEKKLLKLDYKQTFNKIREIVNKYDPSSLEPDSDNSNTPVDEYDAEVGRITNYFLHHLEEIKLKPDLLVREINQVWKEYFEEECTDADSIATDIIRNCA